MRRPDRARLLGIEIDRLDFESTVAACAAAVEAGGSARHMSVNAAKIVALRRDDRLRRAVEGSDIVSADGQSVVWASRILGDPLPERVAGIDLMFALLDLSEERGYRVYLLGARPDVLERAVAKLRARYPRLAVCGTHHGYYADEEADSVARKIGDAEPHILFIGMSSPRKELWQDAHAAALGVPLTMGVGGALDVVAGVTRRAPRWMQRAGLEWAYRVIQEPRRLARRYLTTNARFALLVIEERLVRERRRA